MVRPPFNLDGCLHFASVSHELALDAVVPGARHRHRFALPLLKAVFDAIEHHPHHVHLAGSKEFLHLFFEPPRLEALPQVGTQPTQAPVHRRVLSVDVLSRRVDRVAGRLDGGQDEVNGLEVKFVLLDDREGEPHSGFRRKQRPCPGSLALATQFHASALPTISHDFSQLLPLRRRPHAATTTDLNLIQRLDHGNLLRKKTQAACKSQNGQVRLELTRQSHFYRSVSLEFLLAVAGNLM
jgi:hypothetical protein